MRGSLTLTGLLLLVIPLAHNFPLLATISFPLLFVVDGMTSLAAALVLTLLLRSRDRTASPIAADADVILMLAQRAEEWRATVVSHANRGRSSIVWRDRRAVSFYFAMLLIGMVFTQNQSSMPLYIVRDLHYRESFYGILFVLNTLLIVALEVPLNLAMSHWSHRRALMLGMLLTAIGFGAIGLSHGVLAIAATIVIWTFGEMVTFPVGTAYVADIAPPGRNGEYMGAFSSTFSLSMVIGPWAGAAALDRFGPSLMWSGVFFCGMIATGVVALSREPVIHPVDARIRTESTT
jgi:Na+/melibiose symporter-like transporter